MVRPLALVAAAACAWTPSSAQCKPVQAQACVLTLTGQGAPKASPSCDTAAWKPHLEFKGAESLADSNKDGWWESVVQIDLDPAKGCSCAVFRFHYTAEPSGFTVNIGDSPTNDGWGGDGGTTEYCAEVQVQNENLAIYSAAKFSGPLLGVDRLLSLDLPSLKDSTFEMEICDQSVHWTLDGPGADHPSEGSMVTAISRRLFNLGSHTSGSLADVADEQDTRIYAALNRVVLAQPGQRNEQRTGSGLAQVEIFLTP